VSHIFIQYNLTTEGARLFFKLTAVIDKKVKRNGVALLFLYAKRFGEGFDLPTFFALNQREILCSLLPSHIYLLHSMQFLFYLKGELHPAVTHRVDHNPMPESTLSSSQGLRIWPPVPKIKGIYSTGTIHIGPLVRSSLHFKRETLETIRVK
jgi:hypothetical protein